MSIQDTHHDKSHYERPTRTWVCGRSNQSGACSHGPDHHGNCQTTHECNPVKQNDRYYCTRNPQCNDGPKPDGKCSRPRTACSPVLGRLALRQRFSYWMALLTIGIIVVAMAGDQFLNRISPGELSSQHAALKDECSSCHTQHPDSLLGLISASFTLVDPKQATQKCTKCHTLNNKPLLAHNQFEDDPKKHISITSCQQCHKEHKGEPLKDLAIKNHSCRACHSDIKNSGMRDHPKFKDYPSSRRNQITFDHTRHFKKHFDDRKHKDKAKSECIACHQTDPLGENIILNTFDQSCGECHSNKISGSSQVGAPGVAVFSLPGADIETLNAAKLPVGDWPYDSDQSISPMMSFLMAQDEEIGAISDRAFEIEWLYPDPENPEDLKLIQQSIWKIKHFILKVKMGGHEYLKSLIDKAPYSSLDNHKMLQGINLAAIRQMIEFWMPNLEQQFQWAQNGAWDKFIPRQSKESANTFELGSAEQWTQSGGWYVDQFALLYRPSGHADPWFKNWVELATLSKSERLINQIAAPKGPGMCSKCHSIDQDTTGNLSINWHTSIPPLTQRVITHFSHQQHTNLFDPKGCLHCHNLDQDANYLKAFKERDPTQFESNFKAMGIEMCQECHDDKVARSECQTCHRYHVGEIRIKLSDTRIEDALKTP